MQVVFYVKRKGVCKYRKFCSKFDSKNRQNQPKVRNKEGCTTIHKDVLAKHEPFIMYIGKHQSISMHAMRHQGGNGGANGTSERCCDWCNEVLVLAMQTRDISQLFVTCVQVAKGHEFPFATCMQVTKACYLQDRIQKHATCMLLCPAYSAIEYSRTSIA